MPLKFTLVAALAAVGQAADMQKGSSPLGKVVGMLENMKATAVKEKQEEEVM